MPERVSFFTFGCRLNQAETATLGAAFRRQGFDVVPYGDPADLVVVNTCTITENGDADTRKLVNRITRTLPEAKLALVGCQAQMQANILAEMPNVAWVVGNSHKMDLPSIIRDRTDEAEPVVIRQPPSRKPFTQPILSPEMHRTRANLKIQDGCDFFCSFCVVPYARGRARGREFDDILLEAKALVDGGFRELVLTGVNVGTYALAGKRFLDVVQALGDIEGLQRLRISSIEPTTINEALLPLLAENPRLCRYLHVPLQSGSGKVLAAMVRKYDPTEFLRFMNLALSSVPDLCFGTDVIVGFPGESEEDFEQTATLIRENDFAYLHVFSYSNREHAKSAAFAEQVDPVEIKRRSRILRELSDRKRQVFMSRYLGQTMPVLFEQEKDGRWNGLTDNFIRVQVVSDHDLTNTIAPVYLQGLEQRAMTGTLAT